MASKDRYPQYLVIPGVDDFCHQSFVTRNEIDSFELTPIKDRYDCGVRCCYVGWVALAMGEKQATPEHLKKTTTREFLILSIIEIAEIHSYDDDKPDLPIHRYLLDGLSMEKLGWVMSYLFETGWTGVYGSSGYNKLRIKDSYKDDWGKISPENAHLLYVKVAESLGYDVRHAKNAC